MFDLLATCHIKRRSKKRKLVVDFVVFCFLLSYIISQNEKQWRIDGFVEKKNRTRDVQLEIIHLKAYEICIRQYYFVKSFRFIRNKGLVFTYLFCYSYDDDDVYILGLSTVVNSTREKKKQPEKKIRKNESKKKTKKKEMCYCIVTTAIFDWWEALWKSEFITLGERKFSF